MCYDNAFEMATSRVRYGPGVTAEAGAELKDLGARRVLVVADGNVVRLGLARGLIDSLESEGLDYAVYDRVRVEPTDASFEDAAAFARAGGFDAYVALGGGSTIDTAKAANLYGTHPADFLRYVNKPIGRGEPPPGPLRPLIALPTTGGTGSETTGVAVFDVAGRGVKTGISHRLLKPTLGLIDPGHARTTPAAVAASTGLDVLSHAIESYTAVAYDRRAKPARPSARPTYMGSNPIADVWALEALRMVSRYLPRAVADAADTEARGGMLLAATFAGLGFGNAGVHLPHAMSYPVAGQVRDYRPPGYAVDHAMVPHGTSVIANSPAVFRRLAGACPERHLRAAEAIGADVRGATEADAGEVLARRIIEIMRELGMPSGLAELGYDDGDVPALVEGTLAQERLTALSPRAVGAKELGAMFREAMRYW